MKRMIVVGLLLTSFGCTLSSTKPAPLPKDDFLVIAHRGASAYAPEHTLAAYDMAVQMGADYIELDIQLTKDGKLVTFHDDSVSLHNRDWPVATITFDELQLYSPGEEFNEDNPHYASVAYEELRVIGLDEVLQYFGSTINYYIEIKSPDAYPGIEAKLLHKLQAHGLLDTASDMPKVIIQSFDGDSLKKVFDREPTIPLIQLFAFDKGESLSKKALRELTTYASGIGVEAKVVTKKFVTSMHKAGLDVHPFTINDEKTMRTLMAHGIDGLFTDRPDIAVQLRNEISRASH
ncbi:glycerophosphodiester phosphodiesterase family protein [Sporosarcina sp. YIM B06819]|uniref:glycerophosphodiester phosphodiesterase family protein n=1 Tax=Sporosarcina sp. YIM B06819 TaxID=3081769 RepID=UPI00298C431C|nr:glycerophosphodiester phosphodiesterase family protein [Sporosarcina sp. YIM B06819]